MLLQHDDSTINIVLVLLLLLLLLLLRKIQNWVQSPVCVASKLSYKFRFYSTHIDKYISIIFASFVVYWK